MEINKVGVLVSLFITLIIGIVLLNTTASQVDLATSIYTVDNETLTTAVVASSAPSLTYDDVSAITYIQNATGSQDLTGVCNVSLTAGTLACNATGSTTAYIGYTYEPDGYVRDSSSRTLVNLITIFFALAILAIGFWGLKTSGLMDL